MNTYALDILDSQLQLWHGTNRLLSEPGIANWDGKQYLFGTAASERARQHPHTTLNRYWQSLDTQSQKSQAGNARHHADLAHAQLLALFAQSHQAFSEVALTLPANMNREQIALLLGIVESCPFSASAIIHRSAALASTTPNVHWHLELQWHQALLVPLSYENNTVQAGTEKLLPGCGLLALQDALADRIAREFVSQTRFDPLRSASAEQSLHDQLPQVLLTLTKQDEAIIAIDNHRARINAETLADACASIYKNIDNAADANQTYLLLEPVAAKLPGIFNALPNTQVCSEDAIAQAIRIGDAQHNHSEHLHFQRSWPHHATDATRALTPAKRDVSPRPTHALLEGEAWPLTQISAQLNVPWSFIEKNHNWYLQGNELPCVNSNASVSDKPLQIGDTLDLTGSGQLTLIKVN